MASRKSPGILALEFETSAIRFVEMQPEGRPENQVVAVGVVALDPSNPQSLVEGIRRVLAQTHGFQPGGSGGAHDRTLFVSLPLRHAFVRPIDISADTAVGNPGDPAGTPEDLVHWDMAQYLARPLDLYALAFQARPQASDIAEESATSSQRYLAAAYRLSEIEALQTALAEAGAPAPTAIDIDVLAVLGVFAFSYPECLPERTLVIKADAGGTTYFRTRHGEYLGGSVQRETFEIGTSSPAEPQERAEQLLGRALTIAADFDGALGPWQEAERVFLCGDLAGDADFRELLKTRLRAPFALLNPFRVVPGPNPDTYQIAYPGAPFAVGVGLALRPGLATPRLNLLSALIPAEPVEARAKTRPAASPVAVAVDSDPVVPPAPGGLKRALIACLILIVLGLAGLFLWQPRVLLDNLPFDWSEGTLSFAVEPASPDLDSLNRALDIEASALVARQQRDALAWLSELETSILADSAGIELIRSAFTTSVTDSPGTFVLQGVAENLESLSRFQEGLVLIPGLTLDRSASAPATPASLAATGIRTRRAVEFQFTGTLGDSSVLATSSLNHVLSAAETHVAKQRILEAGLRAGFAFDSLPAPAATTSGGLQAVPFRLSATCAARPVRCIPPLHALLENERRGGSPFAIQRILLSSNRDSQVVFLDIMAFSR